VACVVQVGCGGSKDVADPSSVRETVQGNVVGASIRDGRVHAWRGLPFAAPPVGELRWHAPQPPAAWTEQREALESGSPCAQLGGDPIMGNEDCLYLDVFAPTFAAEAVPTGADRLPVMFWIHGGGNSMGSGDMLDPSRLAADNGVIVVTINYRLGILGWLSHPALRATIEDPADASGNYGTLDMIRGLEWVRDNIAAFGGDPNRVTVFGESAGGMNVFSMLLSPLARGLFHGAIAESGSPVSMTRIQAENYTDDDTEGLPGSSAELVISLLRQRGVAESRESAKEKAAAMNATETEAFLRSFSTEELLAPFVELAADSAFPIYITPNIIRDGHVIPTAPPLELFSTPGGYNAVPFIAGTNREEHKLFFAMESPHVSRRFGFPTGFENLRLYDIEGEYGGLIWRAMGADEPISRMRKVQGPSVWSYRFDWDEEPSIFGTDLSKLIGAGHAIEMIFVFGLNDLGFANRFLYEDVESASELSRQIRSYWANFAHTLRPGTGQGGDLPEWTAWGTSPGEPRYLILDGPLDGGLRFGNDEIDQKFVLDRASKDPRLLTDEERCGVFKNFVQWSEALTMESYTTVNDGACGAFPIESRLFFASLSHMNEAD
jgi:para-nitrobenzyl esterase